MKKSTFTGADLLLLLCRLHPSSGKRSERWAVRSVTFAVRRGSGPMSEATLLLCIRGWDRKKRVCLTGLSRPEPDRRRVWLRYPGRSKRHQCNTGTTRDAHGTSCSPFFSHGTNHRTAYRHPPRSSDDGEGDGIQVQWWRDGFSRTASDGNICNGFGQGVTVSGDETVYVRDAIVVTGQTIERLIRIL